MTLRPSQDLGRLAYEYEPQLPRAFRFLTRGLGTKQTHSPDFLSLILFQPDYLQKLMEIGEADAEARSAEILEFVDAIDAYRQENSRPFPTWTEVFSILKRLGYTKS